MFLRHEQLPVAPRVTLFSKDSVLARSVTKLARTKEKIYMSSSECDPVGKPAFLRASFAQQRENFGLLNALEQDRLNGRSRTCTVATQKANRAKNRYTNVFPWDQTRVPLPVSDSSFSDYINASYVDIPNSDDRYIAAQGPLECTIHHFWAMAFAEAIKGNKDSIVVVMVTPLVESGHVKCSRYWPTCGEPPLDLAESCRNDGIPYNLTISYVSENYNTDGDFLVTELEARSGDVSKTIYHYYYKKWADAKVPPSIHHLLSLSKHIRSHNSSAPIVHCSAGVGRTGTFIAIDHLLSDFGALVKNSPKRKNYDPKRDPILHTVFCLREARMMMVQTVYQYCYLYDSACEMIRGTSKTSEKE